MAHSDVSFMTRLIMAVACFFRILFNPRFAERLLPLYQGLPDAFAAPTPVLRRGEPLPVPEDMPEVKVVSRGGTPNPGSGSIPPTPARAAAVSSPPVVARAAPASVLSGVSDRGDATAGALFVLAALQREGRLIDFLQQDVAAFTDQDVGAAARVVHEGCRKVLTQYLAIEPVLTETEGSQVTLPPNFDSGRIRVTGNVTGKPPFAGALKHHGWVTSQINFPLLSQTLDPRVIAPAEVELA